MVSASVIRPKTKWLELNTKEFWHSRDLLALLIQRDIVTLYKQTILGPLWVIIQPLLTTLINFLVFGVIAGLGGYDVDKTKAVPTYLFFMAGSVCWSYISCS